MATAIRQVAEMAEVDPLRDLLWSQEWFTDPARRTISRCRLWLNRLQATSRWRSTVETLLRLGSSNAGAHVCVVTHDGMCDTCADAAIGLLLTRSLAGVASVDTLEEAAMYIQRTAGSQQRLLLTDVAIADLLDRTIGGRRTLRRYGADAIRGQLAAAGEMGDAYLGDRRIRKFLSANLPAVRPGRRGPARGTLEDANLLLTQMDRVVGTLIVPAIEMGMDDTERAAVAAFRRSLRGTTSSSGLLALPSPSEVVRHVETMVQTTGVRDETVAALRWVLEPPAHYRRVDRFAGTVRVAEIVWEAIAETVGLPYPPYRGVGGVDEHQRNYEILADLVGVRPTRRQLRLYRRVERLTAKASVPRSAYRRRRPADDEDPVQVTTFQDVYTTLKSFVQVNGTLPSHTALDARLVTEIESVTGMPLREVVAYAHEAYGWRLPAASETERRLGELLARTFRDADLQGQFRDELFGLRSSIDWYVQVDAAQQAMFDHVEVCAEADGIGHFAKAWNWDLAAQRRRDAEKSRKVEMARAAGRNIMLLAVHGDLLKANSVSPERLQAIFDDAVARRASWVFLRPEACTQMRAVHRPASLVDTVDGIEVWMLTDEAEQATSHG